LRRAALPPRCWIIVSISGCGCDRLFGFNEESHRMVLLDAAKGSTDEDIRKKVSLKLH
jgi:hypothetical protein